MARSAWNSPLSFHFGRISVFPRQFSPPSVINYFDLAQISKRNPLAFLRNSLQDVSSRRIWFIRKLISRESVAIVLCSDLVSSQEMRRSDDNYSTFALINHTRQRTEINNYNAIRILCVISFASSLEMEIDRNNYRLLDVANKAARNYKSSILHWRWKHIFNARDTIGATHPLVYRICVFVWI